MSERVPAITLTSPGSTNRQASPFRPSTRDNGAPASSTNARGRPARNSRPTTPVSTSRSREGRPDSSSSWASPSRLIRSRSRNASSSVNGTSHKDGSNADNADNDNPSPTTAIDPLSQHILDRTGSANNLSAIARPTTGDGSANRDLGPGGDPVRTPTIQSPPRRNDTQDTGVAHKDLRKGVKAVSFISRLMGGKKRPEDDDDTVEDESVSNEDRPEGNDAQVFTEPTQSGGFSSQKPQPPSYIKVRSRYKKQRDFDHLFLAQELQGTAKHKPVRQNSSNKLRRKTSATIDPDTIWAMQFSRDGKYLAAAGVDGVVRIWSVLTSTEDRQKHEKQESGGSDGGGFDTHFEHLSSPVFQSQPVREYEGHTATVLDLSWSKNNFLLSSSMDKTVRLWHVSRPGCLCTFKHNDFVPSISFHPKDDRFFLAGSLDSKLRLWSIPDKSVAFTALVPDMITAVAFTPDGKGAMAGCLGGLCMFFETDGLKYQSQVHVRSSRGQNAKGSKITGIQAHYDARGDVKLLITSNDSRVRLYNFRDKNLELKFRGNENNCSQIRASISDDGRYVICGSEDRKAYIWSLDLEEGEKRDKRPVEMFEAHDTITTSACFAPAKTRKHLAGSNDPVYDLCHPPPVVPRHRIELSQSRTSSKPGTENGSVQSTPIEAEVAPDKRIPSPPLTPPPNHADGGIIVTADFTGKIKVFRQDCAWAKRKPDDWDRSSIFSKRNGKVSRQGSTATMASQRSHREPRASIPGASDRIMSWRQGIVSTSSIVEGTRASSINTSRSISPQKLAEQTPKPYKANGVVKHPDSPPLTIDTGQGQGQRAMATVRLNGEGEASPKSTRSYQSPQDENPLMIQGGRSYLFYNTDEWKQRAERMRNASHAADQDGLSSTISREEDGNHLAVRPSLNRRGETYVSELSDERSSGEEDFDDAHERLDKEVKC